MANKTVYLVRVKDSIERHPYNGRPVAAGEFLLINEKLEDFLSLTYVKSSNDSEAEKSRVRDITWDEVLNLNYFTPLDLSVAKKSSTTNYRTTIKLDKSLRLEGYIFDNPPSGLPSTSYSAKGIAIIEGKVRKDPSRNLRIKHYIKSLKGKNKKISFRFDDMPPQNNNEDTFFRYKLYLKNTLQPTTPPILIDPIIRNDGSKRP